MGNGIYLLDCKKWNTVSDDMKDKIDTIYFGHYGCQEAAHYSSKQALTLMNNFSRRLHYISPKTTATMMKTEEQQIKYLLDRKITVSINDWGLLYRLKKNGVPMESIYLGRLLSKSIAEWVWSDIFFKEESEKAILYLSQSNMNHSLKVNWLKACGVAGIEVTIRDKGEESYKAIHKQGLEVIGYADNGIAAISRACVLKHIAAMAGRKCDCKCMDSLYTKNKTRSSDLSLIIMGNMLMIANANQPDWNGYKSVVYDGNFFNTDEQ